MRNIQNTNRPDGYSKTSWKIGNSSATSTSSTIDEYSSDIINQANTVSLIKIFNHYGLRFNEYSRKAICPFKSHKNGRENTASFLYYPNTNSYCCFGCRIGCKPCDFVSEMDGINKYASAIKIISLYKDDVKDFDGTNIINSSEQLEIMMEFSNLVREFRRSHFDEEDYFFIEKISSIYDYLYNKHENFNNQALRDTVDKLKEIIISYK